MSSVYLYLSSGGLPRLPGYSKSMSSPSKFLVLRKVIDVWTNSARLADVASMGVTLSIPKFQPPTASVKTKSGFCCLRLMKRSYLVSQHISFKQKRLMKITDNQKATDRFLRTSRNFNSVNALISELSSIFKSSLLQYAGYFLGTN